MAKFKGPKGPRIHKPNPTPGGPTVQQPGGTRQRMDPAKAQAIVDFSAAQIHHINLTMDLYANEVMRLRQTRDQLNQQLQGLVEEFRKTGAERDEAQQQRDALLTKYEKDPEPAPEPEVTSEEDVEAERQKVRDEVKNPIEGEVEVRVDGKILENKKGSKVLEPFPDPHGKEAPDPIGDLKEELKIEEEIEEANAP